MPPTTLRELPIPELTAGTILSAAPLEGDSALLLTVDQKLGEGATGIAYKVTTPHFAFPLVAKVPLKVQSGLRLLVEARWTPRPSSQHYCYEFMGVRSVVIPSMIPADIEIPVIVTKYYDGGTLQDFLGICKRTDALLAMRWAVQIATALRESQVMHRDIKPDNIFMDAKQNAYLGDYGLAIPATEEERTRCGISLDQWITGTPEYMSPEALLRPQSIDWRSDLYALGLVLYETLVGTPARVDRPSPPEGQEGKEEKFDVHKYINELRSVGFAIPLDQVASPSARKIIANCTAVRRDDRYKSWDHFIADAIQHAGFPDP